MRVALVGVGGTGGAVVDAVLGRRGGDVVRDAVVLDTSRADLAALEAVPPDRQVLIGSGDADGTGGDPERAAELLRADGDAVRSALSEVPVGEVDAILVVAGLGGGTGGGCGPLLAGSIADRTGVPVFGLAVLPPDEDGEAALTAAHTLRPFAEATDGLVVFDADAFPDRSRAERIETLVERVDPLLGTTGDLPPATVVETLRAGVSTLGYATDADPDAVDADRVTGLAQESTLSDLTLLANCASADRVLVVATGPAGRVPRSALDEGRGWVGTHADVSPDAIDVGVVDGPDDRVAVLTVFAGVTEAPRVDRLGRLAAESGPGTGPAPEAAARPAEETVPDADDVGTIDSPVDGSDDAGDPPPAPGDGPLPTLVVAENATSGGRPHGDVAVDVAAVDATLTAGAAEDLAATLPDLGGQTVLVAGDVSDRAARTLAATGITAVSVDAAAFDRVTAALSVRPVTDPRSLSPRDLGTVAGVEYGERGGVTVEGPGGEVRVRADRGEAVRVDPVVASPPTDDADGDDRTPSDAGRGAGDTDPGRPIPAAADAGPPSSTPTVPSAGAVGGDVRMGEYLGETDRATVRAAHTPDGDRVAVKFPEFGEDPDEGAVRRAFRAVDAWQGIGDHDNVAAVLDRGLDPRPWIALEYLDGDCSELSGPLPPDEAAWMASRIAAAVEYAHDEGVLHLALHPGNVGLRSTPAGTFDCPRVTDWGLSRVLLDDSDAFGGFPTEYAAPEQLDDGYGEVDAATDVYQLGVVCYELFTGDPPFEGLSTGVMGNVLNDRPDPPSEVAAVPPAVDEALGPALAKEQADRYDGVGAFRAALSDLSPY